MCENGLSMIGDPTLVQPRVRLNEGPMLPRLAFLFRILFDVPYCILDGLIRIEKHFLLPVGPRRYRLVGLAVID